MNYDLKCLKIGVCALIHDIGKIFYPLRKEKEFLSELLGKAEFSEEEKDIYCRYTDKGYSHLHALYTVAFIEKLKGYFPKEFFEETKEEIKRGDTFINLAGKHHKPENPLQGIIHQADCLSSGIERQECETEEEIKDYLKILRISVFQNILKNKEEKYKTDWVYPISKFSYENILPKKEKYSTEKILEGYKNLSQNFVESFKKLENKENPYLWTQHLDSLLKIYCTYIPSARKKEILPDVSLYDHLKLTASIAIALYKYHLETDTLIEKEIKNLDKEKFLIISGDFFGIQKFIFDTGEIKKGRTKILRGRSFAVFLYTQIIAEWICWELGLNPLSIFLSSAGKFHILAPNLPYVAEKLEKIREEITEWFFENFYLESGLGIIETEIKPSDLNPPRFKKVWKNHLKKFEYVKYKKFDLKKFAGVMEGYLDRFRNDLNPSLCPFCRKRPSQMSFRDGEEERTICYLCWDYFKIGENLVKNKKLKVFFADKNTKGDLNIPILNKFQIKFEKEEKFTKSSELFKYFQYQFDEKEGIPENITYIPANGYVPVKETGEIKTFEEIAKASLKNGKGSKFLGILKGDLDKLGDIFSRGFEEKYFNISRLVTLSRELENFFGFFVPLFIKEKYKEIYTVFSGGDDFFLIGPWGDVLHFVNDFYEVFKNFVCQNEKITFSAGYIWQKPEIPFYRLAENVEERLSSAKDAGRNKIGWFEQIIEWKELKELLKIKEDLEKYYESKKLSRSMLFRLIEIVSLSEKEKKYIQEGKEIIKDYQPFKWRAYLYYYGVRNIKDKDLIIDLTEKIEKYREKLFLPFWYLVYEYREIKS